MEEILKDELISELEKRVPIPATEEGKALILEALDSAINNILLRETQND